MRLKKHRLEVYPPPRTCASRQPPAPKPRSSHSRQHVEELLRSGKFAGGFDDLARKIIRHVRIIARFDHVCGTEELLFAIAQRVANRLLYLRIGQIALARWLFRNQLQYSVALVRYANR